MKFCTKCKENKELESFGNSKSKPDGLYHWCKLCVKEDNFKRRKHKENGTLWKMNLIKEGLKFCYECSSIKKIIEFGKNKSTFSGLQAICKECKVKKDLSYRNMLKDKGTYKKSKQDEYNKNIEKYRDYSIKYNKEKRDYKLEYQTTLKLREKNPLRKLANAVRNRLLSGLKYRNFKKSSPSIKILGADWVTIEAHISKQFLKNMSWSNHGEWHIDHVIPLASATTEDEFFKLCHYSNLQPLWKLDNLKKGTKLNKNPSLN